MTVATQVLVVEDDDKIAPPLVRTLEREGYAVERVAEGLTAVERIASGGVDLVLLDLGLPDIDGLEVCRRVREGGYVGGIIILTARDGELDRVVGLDVGADDYLSKPFALAELLARARALLRRSAAVEPAAPAAAAPAAAGLRVDPASRRIWVDDTEVAVTSKEFDVLVLLDEVRGAVVTRERLTSDVWDENWFGSTKMVDATVGRLRQKLEEAGAPVQITNVRGVGFRLEDQADA
ncbi:DNA-binding response regulator, OmpR family, contains REC and winged-helix (wHTH) domain [Aeromicrobium choanae]|uniref:DNA-binding response regulator, OmpR family, contains REC and winged-helix (WHTH) domain n=1 Tax=Aeromicrobium choanae TaxID=1736691 RepID=A0A1T4YXQ6_9ACTN|nr:DNA-binding response regulator, OmpR family, contains REC and winged-helix (wHTH) domain [Aeromicrobium choanae]